jgi:outer membrane protein assembly factor BamB
MALIARIAAAVAYVLVAAALAILFWLWFLSDRSGQSKMLTSVPIFMALGVFAIIALLRIKGPSRKVARPLGFALLAAAVATPVFFRIKGVTGDFMPVLEYRFAPKADTTLPILPGVAPAQPEPVPAAETAPAPIAPPGAAPPAAHETPGATTALPDTSVPAAAPATPPAAESAPPAPVAETSRVSFPQYLGATRDGHVPGVRLARDWSAQPPKLVWKIPVGAGWSGFVIDRGLAITQEQRGGDEMVVAYDLATGAPRWSHRDPIRYDSVIAGDGPRATPTIDGAYVATLGSTGRLNVLDFRTGRRLWQKDVVADNDAVSPEWGRSGSPLIHDGKVIVSAGGEGRTLVAYDLKSGERVWRAGTDGPGYAAPMLLTLLGRPQVVAFNRATMTGHDPATGAVLWSQTWPGPINVAQPIKIADDLVLGSAGYGIGAKLTKLTGGDGGAVNAAFVWESPRLKAKFTNPVFHDGFVYGLDDGVLVCLDVQTGERRWRAGRYGHGQTLLVGDVLLVMTEYGDVVLVEPTPAGHRELTSFTALDGKTWNPPAVAGKYLLVRSDKEAALYELALR